MKEVRTLTKPKARKFWDIKASAPDTADIYIYGDIVSYKWDDTDVTAEDFRKELEGLGDVKQLNIYVNSYGGSVFQAQAIYSQLKRHPAQKSGYIDGIAASAASVIVAACDTVYMPENAMQMIHWPWTFAMGNAVELQRTVDGLIKIGQSAMSNYLSKAGDKLTEGKLIELLDAESWLTAQDCLEIGLCDEVIEAKEVAASATELASMFKNMPETLKNQITKKGSECLSDQRRKEITERLKMERETLNYEKKIRGI